MRKIRANQAEKSQATSASKQINPLKVICGKRATNEGEKEKKE
jgi:hypothetical protein